MRGPFSEGMYLFVGLFTVTFILTEGSVENSFSFTTMAWQHFHN